MSGPELKPCPWPDCSSQPDVIVAKRFKDDDENGGGTAQGYVECWDCGARGPATCHYEWQPSPNAEKFHRAVARAKARAADLWNKRVPNDVLIEALESLVAKWEGDDWMFEQDAMCALVRSALSLARSEGGRG